MFNTNVNAGSSSSTEMEKDSEIRKGLQLAACESTQAHLELWAAAQGNPNPTCKSLYPDPALDTIHILIFLHFQFHEKEQRIQGVSVLGSAADTAAYTHFLSLSWPLTGED